MNVAKTVLRNVAANWVGFGSQVIVTLLLTPFVIKQIGTEAYGLWLLLQSAVGYYGMVDMGLRAGLTQTITRRIARQDYVAVRQHLGAAVPLLAVGSGIVLIAASILAATLPNLVSISESLRSIAWVIILIQAIGVAIQVPLAPFSAVLVGLQRFDVINSISIVTRIIYALSVWVVLAFGGGLIGLAVVILVTNTLDSCVRLFIARRFLPELRGMKFKFAKSEVAEMTSVGVWNFLIQISRQLIYFSDALVVGLLFSASAVAPYGIAGSLVDYGNRIVVLATRVLFPTMAALTIEGNRDTLRTLYIGATRLTIGVSLSILILGIAWVGPFLRLWLGETPENAIIHEQAPSVFAMLAVAFSFVGMQRTGIQLILAENQLKTLASLLFCEAVINLVLSLLLGWRFGIIGVAVGTVIPAAILGFCFHLPLHSRILEISYSRLLQAVLLRPLLFFGIAVTSVALVRLYFGSPETWLQLVAAGIVSGIVLVPPMAVLVSRRQRKTIFSKFSFVRKFAFQNS